jgi:hypothetical protein
MTEIPLAGGDVNIGENVVVRVGDTVRRPLSDRAPAVHALLLHFEAVGFEGAPRVLGIDEHSRETLSYETHRLWGGIERRPGWAEMWDAGSGDEILARNTWFEAVRDDLLAFLR